MRNYIKTMSSQRRCAGGRSDRRGSAIILVLVSIVLMAILAATLLQLTRFERIPQPTSNIEVVIESVIDEILSQATEDLVDNNGNFFNPINTTRNGGGDEPWDFPWTNPSKQYGREVETSPGTTEVVMGGHFDDGWLASNAPDFRSAVLPDTVNVDNTGASLTNTTFGVWRKITCLSGMFIGGNRGTADLSSRDIPLQYPLRTPNNELYRDMNVRVNHPDAILVDADGDGIGDSRWEWAPLKQIGTTQYVMAVRIIDLSGRVDLNVATGVSSGPTSLGVGNPYGDSPAEIDGSGVVALMAGAAGSGTTAATALAEYRNLQGFRLTGNTASSISASPGYMVYDGNADDPDFPSRRHYWVYGASQVSTRFTRNGSTTAGGDYSAGSSFGVLDAFDLLYNNGLNTASNSASEDLMPNFFRRGALEDPFSSSNTTVTGNNWSQRNFWELNPRLQFSPFTGSAVFAPALAAGTTRDLKFDVNRACQVSPGRSDRLDDLSDAIQQVIDASPSARADLLAQLPHLNNSKSVANQLAANMADYIDDNNAVTVVGDAPNLRIGHEALPYIAELYTQRLYQVTAVTPNALTGKDDVTWDATGRQGYVLEIGNPYARFQGGTWVGRPVSLRGIYLQVNNQALKRSLIDDLGAPAELQPGEVLLLYQNSFGNSNDATLDDLSNYHTNTSPMRYTNVYTINGPVLPAPPQSYRFRLYCEESNASGNPTNTPADWSYCGIEFEVSENSIDEEVTSGDIPVPGAGVPDYQGYVQTSYIGVGQTLRMMAVNPQPQSSNPRGFVDTTTSLDKPSLNCSIGSAGTGVADRPILGNIANLSKPNGVTGFARLGTLRQQIVWPDSERERMHWIGDILQIPIIGPMTDASNTYNSHMSEALFAANLEANVDGIEAVMLPYEQSGRLSATNMNTNKSVAIISGYSGVLNYPISTMLLERLTTYNPATDGRDGDGQNDSASESPGNPDDDETLVPGRININSASFDTLVAALPYPDLTTRQAIAAQIIDRRESLTQFSDYGIGADGVPAVAYTSALLTQIEALSVNRSNDTTDTSTLNGQRIDLNDYESPLGTYPVLADAIFDDREEQIMLAKWINEVAGTRSDVFAAYVVVQGYPADNFTAGAVESARLIVLFSRANVQGSGDRAIELGRYRIQ